jgi:hypothetical protein
MGRGLACQNSEASLGFKDAAEFPIRDRLPQKQVLMQHAAEAPAKAACGITPLFGK